jgi:hypothetical protein
MTEREILDTLITSRHLWKLHHEADPTPYTLGVYNGIEMCLSKITGRDPEFIPFSTLRDYDNA